MILLNNISNINITNDNISSLFNLTFAAADPIANPAKSWAPIVVPIFFAILLVSGLVGNLTIIYIILRHKYMQITPNLYIMNLAIGDLLLLIFSAPFTALSYIIHDTYPFGTLLCKIDQISQNLTLGVTIFTLMALSYDRCSSIRDPIVCHTNKSNRTKRSQIGIILIWSAAILCCIPDGINTTIINEPKYPENVTISSAYLNMEGIFGAGGHSFSRNLTSVITTTASTTVVAAAAAASSNTHYSISDRFYQVCYPYHTMDHENPHFYMKIRVVLRFLIYFLIPILIIGTFYTIIAVVLLRPFKFLNTVDNLIETIEEENNKKNNNNNNSKKRSLLVSLNKTHRHNGVQQQNGGGRVKRSFKKFSLYSSIYDNTEDDAATDVLELKNLNGNTTTNNNNNNNNTHNSSYKHTRKLNSVSSMRSSTANYIVNRRHIKARLKIVKMVLFLVIIFILLCLPEHIYYIIWYFTKIPFSQGLLMFRILSSCAFYAHASIHAYVLFCLSSKFRYYGHNLLLKCNKRILLTSNQQKQQQQHQYQQNISPKRQKQQQQQQLKNISENSKNNSNNKHSL